MASTPTITWQPRLAGRTREVTRNFLGYAPRYAESNINDDHGRPGRQDYTVRLLPPAELTLTATTAPVADAFTERLLGGETSPAFTWAPRRTGLRTSPTHAWRNRRHGLRSTAAPAWTERLLGGDTTANAPWRARRTGA